MRIPNLLTSVVLNEKNILFITLIFGCTVAYLYAVLETSPLVTESIQFLTSS
jgi:hypothetical protein